jgi:8-oxo-dGTP pyrophosphatase MutT (NUDIX family)
VPANPKGYSDPQQEAVKAATSGAIVTADVLKSVARLSPKQVNDLDDADRKAILGRLAFIATHPKADDAQKREAAAYGRIINSGSLAEKSRSWDHSPSLGELHREEEASGLNRPADALKAATDVAMDRSARIKAMTALSKAQFDALSDDEKRKITGALNGLDSDSINTVTGADKEAIDKAFKSWVGMHPGVYRMETAYADFKAGKIQARDLHRNRLWARVQVRGAGPTVQADRDALDAVAARIARNEPGLPTWLRATFVGDAKYGGPSYAAIVAAQNEFNWEAAPRLSSTDMRGIFGATDDDLKGVDPLHAEAVKELRANALKTGLRGQPGVPTGSPWSIATRNQAVNEFLGVGVGTSSGITGPEVSGERMAMFNALPPDVQQEVTRTVRERLRSRADNHAKTETYIVLRRLEGLPPLTGAFRDAFLEAGESYAASGKVDVYRRLDPTDFQSMPSYTRDAITSHLDQINSRLLRGGAVHRWQPTDNALKVMPKALAAHLDGTRLSAGLNRNERNVADFALYGQGIIAPEDRVDAYSRVTPAQLANLPGVSAPVFSDLRQIEASSALPLQTRYNAAMNGHVYLQANTLAVLNQRQVNATEAVDPNPAMRYSDAMVSASLNNLTKADFDALPPTLREAIDDRVRQLPGADQQLFTAKFHPAPSAAAPAVANLPSGTVPLTAQTNVPANVQEALDVLYGTNPKAHTMAAQLKAYGGLRGSDFNAFNVQEQQQLLADLSFIATTAKGPSADKARKLIDRFTPPGTPPGQTPASPAIIPPANSVPGQVRYATPQVGTLVMAKDKGKGGDGWITTPGGKRVWGKYGAAGLLLMHRDPGTGEKRYLMVQRGPAISDPGKWQFPGGAIDEKETFHQGGAREVIEELGFKPDDLKSAAVVGEHTNQLPGSNWKYVSIAAEVPAMLKPDLSSHHARMETSDAKWMTEAEIRALDTSGKLLAPLAGGKLEQNVMSLFPATPATGTGKLGQVARPGPVTRRQNRLTMPAGGRQSPASFNAWPHPHKPSNGKNLVPDKAAIDAMRQKVKQERVKYDGKTADGRLAAIGAMQGYDELPTVVSKSEIDRLLATGDYIEAWRGVSGGGWSARGRGASGGKTAAQINEEMRSGPAYYGKGIFGNGYYLATKRSVADQYSDRSPGSMVRILIPKSAIIKKYPEMRKEAEANSQRLSKAKGGGYDTSTFWDPGRWAAAKGVDGIEIGPNTSSQNGGGSNHVASTGKPAFNWLNRSVLIIQKEPG